MDSLGILVVKLVEKFVKSFETLSHGLQHSVSMYADEEDTTKKTLEAVSVLLSSVSAVHAHGVQLEHFLKYGELEQSKDQLIELGHSVHNLGAFLVRWGSEIPEKK